MTNFLSSYMNAYPDRFLFTDADKKDCFDTISSMMKLAQRAGEVKPPNLEEEAYQTETAFLRKALFLYVDNVERDPFAQIMESYIVFGGYAGKELLERLIILECMMGIYNAEGLSLIEERLKAFLGEVLSAEYESTVSLKLDAAPTVAVYSPQTQPVVPEIAGFLRKKIEPKPSGSNVILSQAEIDDLVKTMLG